MKIPSLRCPVSNGGCGRDCDWTVAVDRLSKRIIADCVCGYRVSFYIDIDKLDEYFTGPLDESGSSVTL